MSHYRVTCDEFGDGKPNKKEKRGERMAETIEARKAILLYMESKDVSYSQLSLLTGYTKSEIHRAVTGKTKSPRANEIILTIVKMFGLS